MVESIVWAIVELMGHLTLSGRLTKMDSDGRLWQVDIPDGKGYFRTELFGNNAVYRIRIVSEEIAREYARPAHALIEYDAPIVTREQYDQVTRRAQEALERLREENRELRCRLTAVEDNAKRRAAVTAGSRGTAPEEQT